MADFIETLQVIKKGRLLGVADDLLTELVRAVHDEQKGGSLTLTLEVKPKGDGLTEVHAKLKVAKPSPDVGAALFWSTEEGGLERSDPKQTDLVDELERLRGPKGKA